MKRSCVRILAGIAALSLLGLGCSSKKPSIAAAPVAVEPSPPPSPPPPPPPPRTETEPETDEERWFRTASIEELQQRLQDVFFDYDRYELKPEARSALQQNFEWLTAPYNTLVVEVEGHADERGTPDYNLSLGDRRSGSVASYLLSMGFPQSRMSTISYGKERPQCVDANERCWWRNRRAHLRVASKGTAEPRTSE